jgi:3-deoxy-manno-octulosonate cytidylyltransferase (CMP-KDO synthetase)
MKTLIVIPARFASTRLPGKPLLRETGKYLIQHVYERAAMVRGAMVVVATDDERIRSAVESFGGTAVMTREDHPSGTDRVAEVAALTGADAVVNLQGDEPLFDPANVESLLRALAVPGTDVSTLAAPIRDAKQYADPNAVKVVCADDGRALYFSRSPIPHYRDTAYDPATAPLLAHLHIGVYAYRRDVLLKLAASPPHPLEWAEKLEQLRLLGRGGTIRVAVVADAHRGVDTPADYAAFVEAYRAAGGG